MTPRDAVASKLMQSTASMITRPSAGEDAPLDVIARLDLPGVAADTLGRHDAPPSAVDGHGELLGPEIGNRPAVAIDDLDVHGHDVDGDTDRRRLVLTGALAAWRASSPGRRSSSHSPSSAAARMISRRLICPFCYLGNRIRDSGFTRRCQGPASSGPPATLPHLISINILDPWMLAIVPIPLVLGAFWACYLPARRAVHIDPNVALRHL